jgi:hypothetical protein
MNTPSHAIINYALLSGVAPRQLWPIVLGSMLPDLPMLVLVIWAKVQGIDGAKLWGEVYWQPFWQDFTHYFHSIPIALALAIAAHFLGVSWLKYLAIAMALHSIGDLPLHHDDAHRHFLPFSQFKFISPISYWDRNHGAVWGALAENLGVLAAIGYLFPSISLWWVKGLLMLLNGLAWIAYLRFFLGPYLRPMA